MMNYKETLLFVGKCLTIIHEEHNRKIVEKKIKSENVNWDNVVKLSTEHYVFPALYCNFKKANLLFFLPEELVNYMMHITNLNRERNLQIIEQAKEINELLLANNITPIFLKGTGNLLEGLYEDIAERMVGDIDFLVSKKDLKKANELLLLNKYSSFSTIINGFRHLPGLTKKNKIARVEIHEGLIKGKYIKEFNYRIIKDSIQSINDVYVISFEDQLCLSIIANQINDDGIYFKNIALRNVYDVFLLSKKTNSLKAIKNYNLLFNSLNNFIALSNYTFGEAASLKYKKTKGVNNILKLNKRLLNNDSLRKKHFKKWSKYLLIKIRLGIIFKSFNHKETRTWLIKRIINGRQN